MRLGYYKDDALELILSGTEIVHRAPIMLRGYYIRNFIMRDVVRKFLAFLPNGNACGKRQIVNLGAGFDTLQFWLKKEGLDTEDVSYYELDFPAVCRRKVKAIVRQQKLMDALGGEDNVTINLDGGSLDAGRYHMIPTDLRNLPMLTKQLEEKGFDTSYVGKMMMIGEMI